jgi:hypothetical protein
MMTVFHFSEQTAWNELPIARAIAYKAWHTQMTYPVELAGKSYCGQEADRIFHSQLRTPH